MKYSEILKKYIDLYPGLSNTRLAEIIAEKEGEIDWSLDYLRRRIGVFKRKEEIIETSGSPSWTTFTKENQLFYNLPISKDKAPNGAFHISVKQADELFYMYSSKGWNLSQGEMMRKYNFKPWEWNAIKNRLLLYKASDIFSPYTEESLSPEEKEAYYQEKFEEKFSDRGAAIERSYNKALRRKMEGLIQGDSKWKYFCEVMATNLFDELNSIPAPKITTFEIKKSSLQDNIHISIADLHVGAKFTDPFSKKVTYNLEIISKRLQRISEVVKNLYRPGRVVLSIVGDLIHTFTGKGAGQYWQELEYAEYGSKAIKTTTEVIQEFAGSIPNLESIYMVSGNHDRTSEIASHDLKGSSVDLIAWYLSLAYKEIIDVEYNPIYKSFEFDGINNIISHGHTLFGRLTNEAKLKRKDEGVKAKAVDFIQRYGKPDMFNLILQGHLHHRLVRLDTPQCRWVNLPSICGSGIYEASNAWESSPGFLIIQNDGAGKPIITDYSFQ